MTSKSNAAIFILTRNVLDRKIYLKTTLYFLFKNFNKKYNYPIIILHEGDYDENSQHEIIKSIRENHRHCIQFKCIDKDDFEIPSHIDKNKVQQIVDLQPVPYWRDIKYRSMCYFWLKHFHKYTGEYDYVMRLDDDSFIEEPITHDLFNVMRDNQFVYMSNIVHIDCGICNYGMKDLFKPYATEEKLDKMFVNYKIKKDMNILQNFKKVFKIVNDKELDDSEDVNNYMPLMFYNNFFITETKFWKRNDVRNIIDVIDKHGGIFYYRYGDAPLQTIIVGLFGGDKTSRTVFKYSKRLQREAFIDNNGNLHSYMPKSYEHSSCITNK